MQVIVHYSLHLLAPILIAYIFFRKEWKKVSVIFLLTMLIDLDHLFSSPIFNPERCSIEFHFFHSYIAIICYTVLSFIIKTRIVALGLVVHILTDVIDCLWSNNNFLY